MHLICENTHQYDAGLGLSRGCLRHRHRDRRNTFGIIACVCDCARAVRSGCVDETKQQRKMEENQNVTVCCRSSACSHIIFDRAILFIPLGESATMRGVRCCDFRCAKLRTRRAVLGKIFMISRWFLFYSNVACGTDEERGRVC